MKVVFTRFNKSITEHEWLTEERSVIARVDIPDRLIPHGSFTLEGEQLRYVGEIPRIDARGVYEEFTEGSLSYLEVVVENVD